MRIDFYLIKAQTQQDCAPFLMRLIQKIYHKHHPIWMRFEEEATCEYWDDLLWTHKTAHFIPHEKVGTTQLNIHCPTLTAAPVGINLARDPWLSEPPARLIEVVPNDPIERQHSRMHYKTYQQQKFAMMIHNLDQ